MKTEITLLSVAVIGFAIALSSQTEVTFGVGMLIAAGACGIYFIKLTTLKNPTR